jgi:hypothetical protein
MCLLPSTHPSIPPRQVHAAARRGVRPDELDAADLVVTSAFSKMVASTATYPHEARPCWRRARGLMRRARRG